MTDSEHQRLLALLSGSGTLDKAQCLDWICEELRKGQHSNNLPESRRTYAGFVLEDVTAFLENRMRATVALVPPVEVDR